VSGPAPLLIEKKKAGGRDFLTIRSVTNKCQKRGEGDQPSHLPDDTALLVDARRMGTLAPSHHDAVKSWGKGAFGERKK